MNLSFLKVENTGILISGPPQVKCRHLIYSIFLVMSLMILWTPEVDQMLKSGDLLEFQSSSNSIKSGLLFARMQ